MRPAVAASFGRAARSYAAQAAVQMTMAEWLAEWLPDARRGRVLEVGAGPGVFTEKLHPWSGPIVATDAVPAMCAAGRAAVPDAEWRVMPAEAPAPGPWDWIVSSSMLQWVDAPAEVFAAWRNVLAPRGRILAGWFIEESLPELRSLVGAEGSPVTWRTQEAWRADIARGGLRVLRDEVSRRELQYPDARAFLRALHDVGAAPERRLSAGALRRVLRDYTTRFGAKGRVRATWTFYRMEAAVDLTTGPEPAHSL